MTKKDGDRLREIAEEMNKLGQAYGPGSTTQRGLYEIEAAIHYVLLGTPIRVNPR